LLKYSRKKEDINKLVEEYSKISDEQLEKIVDQVIQENIRIIEEKGDKAFNVIMGKVMSKVRGKVEGKKVAEIISKRMKNYPRS
jgi:Archaeal Glu-tRNAGln amidotransferase subunit E (contains GAD domain)